MNRLARRNKLWLTVALIVGVGVACAIAFRVLHRNGPGKPAERPGRDQPQPKSAEHRGEIHLVDVTEQTGVTFVHTDGGSGKYYIVETVSAGLALLDYDGDGDEDIYFLNGAPLRGTEVDAPPRNALYRNQGDWKFTDVTEAAGVGDTGFGLGVAAGDYDNDGDLDLYLNNYGPNVLYRNNSDGTFTDVTGQAGVANGNRVGAGVCFLDADADGDLDLYVAGYVKFSYDTHKPNFVDGAPFYPVPLNFEPEHDVLYRNNGDGTFTDVSAASGLLECAGTGMGTISCDYDNDGDVDLFVANDEMANTLLENDGRGRFREVGVSSGTAFETTGMVQGSMGVDCGDYDNDGWLDLHVTSYENELATLYHNLGGFFHDATRLAGGADATLRHVTWGNGFVDFDNDGDRDLFIACGHTDDNVKIRERGASYLARNVLLMNTGQGKFVNVSDSAGPGMAVKLSSRGAGFGDLDNDGDLDVVVLNSRRRPTLLRNDSPGENHWLQVKLLGTKSNRGGVGARVRVIAGELTQIDEVHGGRGYQSHWGTRLHFGLGGRDRVDRIEVRWIGGGLDTLEDVAADQCVTVTEGKSEIRISKSKTNPKSECKHSPNP